jgi:hypothetical protein
MVKTGMRQTANGLGVQHAGCGEKRGQMSDIGYQGPDLY